MNRDILAGNWKQFRGEVQTQWGKLTNDDLDIINGEYDQLVGRLQTRYGWDRERTEREVNDYFARQPIR